MCAQSRGMDELFQTSIQTMDMVTTLVSSVDVEAVRNFTAWLATPQAKVEILNITSRSVGVAERAETYLSALLQFSSRLRLDPLSPSSGVG